MSHAQNNERAAAILSRRSSGQIAHDEALVELADADCTAALAAAIAERLSIRTELVLRALDADKDETISVMCRAAGFKINSYSAVLRMRRRRNRGNEYSPALALTFFSTLSRAAAERMLPRMAVKFGRRKA